MKLHTPTVILSLGVVALGFLLSSQSGPLVGSGFRTQYMPHPRDMMTLEEGSQFHVPPGKLFVLTGLGTATSGSPLFPTFRVNGSPKLTADTNGGSSVVAVPLGLTVPSGHLIKVTAGGGGSTYAGRAWGYLANE